MVEKSEFIFNFTKDMLPHANEINFAYNANTFDWPQTHTHADYWEFTILTDGVLNNYLNGEMETYRKHSLFFSTTSDLHALKKAPGSGSLRYINLMVRETYLLELMNHITPSFAKNIVKGKRHYELPPSLIGSIEDIIHRVNLLQPSQYVLYNQFLCCALLLILQFILLERVDVFENNPPWMNKLTSIETQPQFLTFSVGDLCRELNYSNAQLTRLFRSYLNTTPNEYLIQQRFRYACNLLKNTDMTILNVAMQIGYANLSQFNIQFKKRFSLTPSQYRKANKYPNKVIPL